MLNLQCLSLWIFSRMQLRARGMLQCDIKDCMAFRAMNLIKKATTTSAFKGQLLYMLPGGVEMSALVSN